MKNGSTYRYYDVLNFPILCAAALQALKRKKRYEEQLAQVEGSISALEEQGFALDNAITNTDVLNTMKTASDALKSAHKNM